MIIMKTNLFFILLLIALFFNCKKKEDFSCDVIHDDFPFHDTLYDGQTLTKIFFLKNGNFWIQRHTFNGTPVFQMEGNFNYELKEHAEWETLDPYGGGGCFTFHNVSGTITITQSSDTSCIDETLNFEYQLVSFYWDIHITGDCYALQGNGYFD